MPENDERQGRKMGMTDIDDIIARLEAGETGRELDADIHVVLHPDRITHPKAPAGYTLEDLGDAIKNKRLAEAPYIHRGRKPSPYYTTSLDAITEAIEAAGFDWTLSSQGNAYIYDDTATYYSNKNIKPAAALCIAFLKALKDQEDGM